jgi:hypothetical protein
MQGAYYLLDCLFEEILIVAPTRRAHPAGLRNFDYLVDVEAVDEQPNFGLMIVSTTRPPFVKERPSARHMSKMLHDGPSKRRKYAGGK